MDSYNRASTGLAGLDEIFDGLRLGDNVVWQVDAIEDFRQMVTPYVDQARRDGRHLVYLRYGSHPPLIEDLTGITVHELDPNAGFESFARTVNTILTEEGHLAFYVFDSLTDLLNTWHSDLMVMNFFKVTCPYLYELDTIAYFALIRSQHTFETIAGIRETTQLLLDLHHIEHETYVHPLKVWSRHSPTMFFPHLIRGDKVTSITSSGASARLFASLNRPMDRPDHWKVLLDQGWQALYGGDEPSREHAREQAKELLMSVLLAREGRMLELCREYLSLADILTIASREIGTGYIGGKSVGMLVARAILERDDQGPDGRSRFDDRLEPHDSYYLGSDLFYTYIIANGWWKDWTRQKTPEGYFEAGADLRGKLATGRFPPWAREAFLRMLEYFGQSPIIVRSSSLLEDNFGNAFAGKYDSVFCANQGTPEERHHAFEDAVRTVYSSAMSEEALIYRRNRGLVDKDEQMAILVQRVSGDHHGGSFFPHAAGVGNSSNLYVWDPSVDPEAGMVRLVFGLGTHAVDRTVQDYARIVTLDDPRRRIKVEAAERARFSQRHVDVLSMETNELTSVPLRELTGTDIKTDWDLFVSPDEMTLARLRELGRPTSPTPVILDFEGLLTGTDVAAYLRDMLRTIATAYDYPVDVEFTVNLASPGTDAGSPIDYRVNVVQCRPLQTRALGSAVTMPALQDPGQCFFSTRGDFMGGNVQLPLDYVVVVRSAAYITLDQQTRHAVARQIGVLNRELRGSSFMLMGPGRWGTSTPSLGVPVKFAEICHASVLCEVTYAEGGFRPELSYGSHFFQDLVESGIFYAAVFDERPDVVINRDWVFTQPNVLTELDPHGAPLADVIHVARFEDLVLYSDVVTQRLICC
ncbi:MAG: pyruvate kinase [Austwickia sp.]|nr:pyruvate kinase [Austwickia sp.]MBK8437464.1 pyruvate kinase [Austwickia sp.]MBK9102729.1 pyruvate kinase [Austwickia sp.]